MISLNLKILQSWRSYQSIFYLLDFKLVQSSYFYCREFFDKVVTKFQIQLEVKVSELHRQSISEWKNMIKTILNSDLVIGLRVKG